MPYHEFQRTALWAIAIVILAAPLLVAAEELPSLRIMPLGDSITKGNGSPDGNGYRETLREKLITAQEGTKSSTDMIGSLQNGNMTDNDHEGHSGKCLADIREYLEFSLPAKPNIVLVHAGTNNMDLEEDLDKADILIESIIDRLFEGSPGVTVLVAPVIWANDPRMQANTDIFNWVLLLIGSDKMDDTFSQYRSKLLRMIYLIENTLIVLAMVKWRQLGTIPSLKRILRDGFNLQLTLMQRNCQVRVLAIEMEVKCSEYYLSEVIVYSY